MENAMSNGKKKVSKMRTLSENVPSLQIDFDENRGRYLQSTTMSPGSGFQPYAENIDFGSPPLARYFYAGSPISGKSGDSFNSPIFGASKYRSTKMQQYSGGGGLSSGNSSFSSRGRLSLSPLSSIENFEIKSPPPMYRTPVKGDEEVIVMDDIQVRSNSGGKNGRSSSSSSSGRGSRSSSSSSSTKSVFKTDICRAWEESGNCHYKSKCQFAHGREELHPSHLSMNRKSEPRMGKQSVRSGLGICSPNRRIVHELAEVAEDEHEARMGRQSVRSGLGICSPNRRIVHEVAEDEHAFTRPTVSQAASPEPRRSHANSNTIRDWSPLDDGIEVVLPNGSEKVASREEFEAHIFGLLNRPTTKRRLPVFAALCKGE